MRPGTRVGGMYEEVGENRSQKQRGLRITQFTTVSSHSRTCDLGWVPEPRKNRQFRICKMGSPLGLRIYQQGLNLPDRTLTGLGDETQKNIYTGGYTYIRLKNT